MSKTAKIDPEAKERAERKKSKEAFDKLPKPIKDLTTSLQELTFISQFLNEGNFRGQTSDQLVKSRRYVRELHFQGMLELEKNEEAMKIKGLQNAVDEAKRAMSEEREQARTELINRFGNAELTKDIPNAN